MVKTKPELVRSGGRGRELTEAEAELAYERKWRRKPKRPKMNPLNNQYGYPNERGSYRIGEGQFGYNPYEHHEHQFDGSWVSARKRGYTDWPYQPRMPKQRQQPARKQWTGKMRRVQRANYKAVRDDPVRDVDFRKGSQNFASVKQRWNRQSKRRY